MAGAGAAVPGGVPGMPSGVLLFFVYSYIAKLSNNTGNLRTCDSTDSSEPRVPLRCTPGFDTASPTGT